MNFRRLIWAVVVCLTLLGAEASAKTLRYANKGDLKSLDPYTLTEVTAIAHLGNVYEGLTRRDKNLVIIPGLAERWEIAEPTRWRFHLRKGVTFANGEAFTADDVLFSAARVRADGSNFGTRIPNDATFVKVDDHTVDVVLKAPNPILIAQWDTWYIMSRTWAEANNAVAPTPASAATPGFAALNANGTGPFRIESHQPGVRTVFKPRGDWWDKPEHNLTEVIFTPIGSDATRVAALLSGEVDIIEPVPVQDIPRVNASSQAKVLTGPELRTIFLGFDQARDELLESDVKGKNPFKDVRVRKAFYKAIDVEAIRSRIMRGLSTPSALMIAPELFPMSRDFTRPKADAEEARGLLVQAGYPNGFTVGMDCPNDRYVNDEQICQAVVGMLARIGVRIVLNAQPKAQYFAKVLKSGGYRTSFFMLGWTPAALDSHNVLYDIMGCRDDASSSRGESNLGNYCNKALDALTDQILFEVDPTTRNRLIKEAYQIAMDDYGFIPLHQQSLAWGVAKTLQVALRADNSVVLYWIRKN